MKVALGVIVILLLAAILVVLVLDRKSEERRWEVELCASIAEPGQVSTFLRRVGGCGTVLRSPMAGTLSTRERQLRHGSRASTEKAKNGTGKWNGVRQ